MEYLLMGLLLTFSHIQLLVCVCRNGHIIYLQNQTEREKDAKLAILFEYITFKSAITICLKMQY